ncbi:hypothetical protein C8R45DRAFT_1070360, partial [Mycena sanguinolenta]
MASFPPSTPSNNLSDIFSTMNESTPIVSSPTPIIAQKRNHAAGPGSADNDNDNDTVPTFALPNQNVVSTVQRYGERKRLRPEQLTDVALFVQDSPAVHEVKLLINVLHLENELGKIVTSVPQFEVSPALEKNVHDLAIAVLLSSKISTYKGSVPTNTLLEIIKKQRFDLPVGIENRPADFAKVITAVQDAFTQLRSKFKKALLASLKATKGLRVLRQALSSKIFSSSLKASSKAPSAPSMSSFVLVSPLCAELISRTRGSSFGTHLKPISPRFARKPKVMPRWLQRPSATSLPRIKPSTALPGETDRLYPNRPPGYLGMICAACPERGVNIPIDTTTPEYIWHLISTYLTTDGNFKLNLFWKRDDGTDIPLTDEGMRFGSHKEDKEPPCRAHIGAIRPQGSLKFGNTAVSGVVASACEHAVVGSFVDLVLGEAFGFVTMAEYHHLKQTNSPPHDTSKRAMLVKERNVGRGENFPETESAMYHTVNVSHVDSYDSYCSAVVNQLKRAVQLFPTAHWFHEKLRISEGQVAAAHINDHGAQCKTMWQPVYFPTRAHFHGESAESVWAFLNALGASTRQMNGGARHDTINFVMDSWNTSKVMCQAELLAAEREEALELFVKHMAVVKYLSNEHRDKVGEWSKMSRVCRNEGGTLQSVYQHRTRTLPTIDNVLDTIIEGEREMGQKDEEDGPPVGMWIRKGLKIEREQHLVVSLLKSHQEHPLMETLAAIRKLRETMNLELADFRERQRAFLPRVKLSALDVEEPEATKLQFPSYSVKHGRATGEMHSNYALAKPMKRFWRFKRLPWHSGKSRSSRAIQKAMLVKVLEIAMYNVARDALIVLGGVVDDPGAAYPVLTMRDTSRKETHLFRANGDSGRWDGTAMYLKDGLSLPESALGGASARQDVGGGGAHTGSPERMVGTQTLKRPGFTKNADRPTKRLKKSDEEPRELEQSDRESDCEPDAGGNIVKSTPAAKKGKGKANKESKSDGGNEREDGGVQARNPMVQSRGGNVLMARTVGTQARRDDARLGAIPARCGGVEEARRSYRKRRPTHGRRD